MTAVEGRSCFNLITPVASLVGAARELMYPTGHKDGPRSTKPREGTTMPLTSALQSKLALGLVAGFVGLVAGGGLATATINLASTPTQQTPSSSTPANQGQAKGHGAEVTAAVAKCKAALKAGQHGIGKCVSAVASQHGKTVSAGASHTGQQISAQDADEVDVDSKP
jgi:hypothetical protein